MKNKTGILTLIILIIGFLINYYIISDLSDRVNKLESDNKFLEMELDLYKSNFDM